MNRFHNPACIVVLAFALAAGARAGTYRITTSDVANSLQLDAGSARITMPVVLSRVEHPALRLIAQAQRGRSVRVRIDCEKRVECPPFYAEIDFLSNVRAEQFLAQARSVSVQPQKRLVPPIVQSGSMAELEIRMRAIRLLFHVRCLEAGAKGDVIRVRDESTKRIYRARVVDKNHLRAEL